MNFPLEEAWQVELREHLTLESSLAGRLADLHASHAGLKDLDAVFELVNCRFTVVNMILDHVDGVRDPTTVATLSDLARKNTLDAAELLEELVNEKVSEDQSDMIFQDAGYVHARELFRQIILKGAGTFFEDQPSSGVKRRTISRVVSESIRKYARPDDRHVPLFKTEELLVREKNKPDAGKNPESIEKLDHLLDDLRGRYRTFIDTLRKEDPSLAVWMTSETIDLGETQMKLGPGEVILEYYIASDQYAYIFVITADGLSVEFVPVDTDKLDKEVMQLRRLLQDPGIEHAPFDPRLNILAKRLYKTLLHPVEKYLEGKETVGILRNRKLHYLPFQVLIRETEGGRGERFLVEDYSIYYLNSRTLLRLAREEGAKASSSPLSLVAFGNPDGTLPYAEEEVLELSNDFKGARVFLRKKATETDLKLFSSGFGLLHLATHGELDPYHPENSFLWFCPDKTEDGKLLVSEIYGLDLARTNLVTLSACETALGKLAYGDEIVALSEAFLFAGTPTVVATLWRVDDRSTALLMKRYYGHLKSGEDKLSALRLAQLDVMKTRGWDEEVELPVDYSHPYFWAPFILVGEHL